MMKCSWSSESDGDSSDDAWMDDEWFDDESFWDAIDSESSSSSDEDSVLPFDPAAIQDIILQLCDRYRVCVDMRKQAVGLAVLSAGLTMVGTAVGKHYGGTEGAAFGEALGSACSATIAFLSLRDVWEELKGRLSDLFEMTYDYIVGLGFKDYQSAASSLLSDSGSGRHLMEVLAATASALLQQKVRILSLKH